MRPGTQACVSPPPFVPVFVISGLFLFSTYVSRALGRLMSILTPEAQRPESLPPNAAMVFPAMGTREHASRRHPQVRVPWVGELGTPCAR